MKKFFLLLPIVSILIFFLYLNAGPNVWTTDTINIGRVLAIAVHPTTSSTIFAGSIDSGVVISTNSGLTWVGSNTGMTYKNSQCLTICRSNPNIMYSGTDSLTAASGKGVYKSTDGGNTWTNVTNDGFTSDRSIQAVAVDPTNPNNVYAGIFNATHDNTVGVWKSTNGGTNWVAANSGMGSDQNILCLCIDPNNPQTIFAGTSFIVATSLGPVHIYKSTNGATTWTDVSNGLPTLTTAIDPVRSIDVSTANSNVVAAVLFMNTTDGGFFLSTNGGTSWTNQSNGLPIIAGANPRAVIFKPNSTTEVYVGIDYQTGNGAVYRSTNAGASWVAFSSGTLLQTYPTRTFSWRKTSDTTLYTGVGTTATPTVTGQGVYEYSFFPVGVINNGNNISKQFLLHQNFPNPFNPSTVITFDLPNDANVSIDIYDISGRLVKNLMHESKQAGTYQISYNASTLSSGVYFYKIKAGNFVDTKKMILLK